MFSNPPEITKNWGTPVWPIPSFRYKSGWPENGSCDIAIIGAGFTGLACALHVLGSSPGSRVIVLESGSMGNGASMRSGGIVLEHTAGGPHPGFENCIDYFEDFMNNQGINCGFKRTGCFEVARTGGEPSSPISWNDSGILRVTKRLQGGIVDPAQLLHGLANAAQSKKAEIRTNVTVARVDLKEDHVVVSGMQKSLNASAVIIATNSMSLNLSGIEGTLTPCMTLALATGRINRADAGRAGWEEKTPFYTTDFPYLWGREGINEGAVFGSGLVFEGEAEFISDRYVQELFQAIESRIKSMHPAFSGIQVTHRWAGPIAITPDMKPVIKVIEDRKIVYAGGYSGHGVAQSIKAGGLVQKLIGA